MDDVRKRIERKLKIAKEFRERWQEGRAYGNLSNAHHSLEDFRKTIDYHERHLNIAKEVGKRWQEGRTYGNLGNAHRSLGDFRKAIDYHERQLSIAKEVGDWSQEGSAYVNLGNDHLSLEDFRKAIDYYERQLKIAKELGERSQEGRVYGNLGNAHHNLGDFRTAIDYYERQLKIAKELGEKWQEGRAYGNLGNAHHSLGDFRTAIDYYERQLKIAKDLGERWQEGRAYVNLGNAYHSLGDFRLTAIDYYERQLKIGKGLGQRLRERSACSNRSSSHHSLGHQLDIAKEVGKGSREGSSYGNLAIVYQGDLPASIMDTVTSEGGEVTEENIRLVFPPGAVDNPLSVNITLEDPSKYYGLIVQKDLENDVMFGAPVICFQPNGHFFQKPVKLTTTFRVKNFKCDDVLIFHGTEARDGKITWQDITHNSKIDEASAEIVIEIEHFSRIVVLLRWTLIRTKDVLSRLNLISFNYTLSLLLNKSSPSSVHDELALLFVSQDVYHEQFYREEDETSALVQLKKQGFKELHVRSIDAQEKTSIYNSEELQVNIDLGEDYILADIQHENIRFNVDSSVWWNAGKVMKLPLEWKKDVRILWGKITLQGEFGHTSKKHFSERDLCGYVRSLLGVEGVIFNVTPIAELLQMPEESMNQVTKSWQGEDEQLDIILKHWLKKSVELDVPAALRKCLEGLNQEDYRVTQRGQMHIRHLREIANKISDLQCVNAVSMRFFSCKVRTLCKSVLRDCCIELELSAEGVERAASSSNHAEYLINHFIENHQPIPDDTAQKYKGVCLQSEESSTKTFLAIAPHLIQNIKEIFVDDESIVPQNGLKGLSEEKVNHFLLSVRNAQRNNKFRELVYEGCEILGKLCLKNDDKQATEEIEEWGESLQILQMLKFLKRKQFFQQCRQDVRLHKRLDLFSRRLKYILTDREDTDEVFIHDLSNVLQSLIHFAKFDPSKLVRFEMFDSTNTPLTCFRENVKYNKHGNTYSQSFRIKKQSDDRDELQLHAIAYVSIDGRICKKGAFQSVIMLNESGEEAFDTCLKRFDVAVMKLEDKSSGNLRLVLCSTQNEKLVEALDALKRELSEDLLDLSQSKITQCHLQMRSIDPAAGAVLSLRLEYKWGSEAVTLDSKDFVTFADSSAGGACIPEGQLEGLDDALMAEGAAAFPLTLLISQR